MKKKVIAAIIIAWIACGFYSWGTIMADLDYRNIHEWPILHLTSRDNIDLCLMGASVPLFAISSALATNFNQHGWELWQRAEAPIDPAK